MKALICGVTGQDGCYLARLLLDKGYEVWGTSRDAATSTLDNLKTLSIDTRIRMLSMAPNDFRSMLSAVEDCDPDEIYYLAGQSSVGLSFQQPAETLESIAHGILNILEIIRLRGKPTRLYNAGSSECFGDTGEQGANELTPLRPHSPYAIAKATAHWLVANYRESYGLFACTGFLFNHESPLRPQRFVTQKIIAAAARIAAGSEEKLTLGRLDICRDWGWAPEYVEAMWRLLQLDTPEDVVVATGQANSLRAFVAEAFALHDLDWTGHVESSAEFVRPADILYSRGDPAKAAHVLDWRAQYDMRQVVRLMSAKSHQAGSVGCMPASGAVRNLRGAQDR